MYVIIHGLHTSTKSPVDYVANIVYGNPRVDAVLVGSRLVAICGYLDEQSTQAAATFNRLGSFNLGAQLIADTDIALREFGTWVRHYAPGTVVGLEDAEA